MGWPDFISIFAFLFNIVKYFDAHIHINGLSVSMFSDVSL